MATILPSTTPIFGSSTVMKVFEASKATMFTSTLPDFRPLIPLLAPFFHPLNQQLDANSIPLTHTQISVIVLLVLSFGCVLGLSVGFIIGGVTALFWRSWTPSRASKAANMQSGSVNVHVSGYKEDS